MYLFSSQVELAINTTHNDMVGYISNSYSPFPLNPLSSHFINLPYRTKDVKNKANEYYRRHSWHNIFVEEKDQHNEAGHEENKDTHGGVRRSFSAFEGYIENVCC